MALTNLSNVVNSKFVLRFTGLAGSGSSRNPLSGSSSTSISSGLRFGAQAFGQAVQGLNAGISFLNITRGTLEELTKITDKLIALTEKSTKLSTSSDARKNLQLDFDRIASEFQNLVDAGKFGNRKVLSLTDMSELFTTIGLDKESSDSIARIFEQFSAPDTDQDSLASEEVKGTRPYVPPANAYRKLTSSSSHYLEKISDGPIQGGALGGISTVNSVYTATDDILNQNPGNVAVFVQDNSGSLQTLPSGTLSSDVVLQSVNETNGFSVIESTEDFLGFNAGGLNQLFLVNTEGQVVHQYTNEATTVDFSGASVSADNLTIAFARITGVDKSVNTITSTVIGENPSVGVGATLETLALADTIFPVKINNDASYVAYVKLVGGTKSVQLRDTATNTADAALAASTVAEGRLGFYDRDKIAYVAFSGSNYIELYTDGVGGSALGPAYYGTDLATLEKTTGNSGYVAHSDFTTGEFTIYSVESGVGTEVLAYPVADYLATGDSITAIGLAYNSSGQVEAMLAGNLGSISGDSDLELYRLRANPSASSGRAYARSTTEYEKIFDGTVDILTRPNAYRMLHDLKAMKSQLAENLDGINYASDIILKNIDLVRAAGFAFLDLSSSVSSEDDADKVAALLRDQIRKNAPAALAQAENLQSIAVAALALSEESILG